MNFNPQLRGSQEWVRTTVDGIPKKLKPPEKPFEVMHLPIELRGMIYGYWIVDEFGLKHSGYMNYRLILRRLCQLKWLQTCRQMRAEGTSAVARVLVWKYTWYAATKDDLEMLKDNFLREHFSKIRFLYLHPRTCCSGTGSLLRSISSLTRLEFSYYGGFDYAETAIEKMIRTCDSIRTVKIVPQRYRYRCNDCSYKESYDYETTVGLWNYAYPVTDCPDCGENLWAEPEYGWHWHRAEIEACQERINEILAARLRKSVPPIQG